MSQKSPANTRDLLAGYLKTLNGLGQVDKLIREKLVSEAPALSDISLYLLELGGKRIRPAICLMSAKALGTPSPSAKLIQIAAGIELIHMATLLHDDIIDKSKIRRHKSSPFQQYGITNTLLTGDFLLVRAFSLCAKLDQFVIERTEQACVELTEGEILEIPLHEKKHSVDSSLNIARKKTAALFRLSCECAAHISDKPAEVVQMMAHFGEHLGIAFQILDDILDVISDEKTLGKEPGSDLRERKPSVVNVLWLASESPLSKTLLKPPGADEDKFVASGLAELQSSPIIAEAKDLAQEYITKSYRILAQVEEQTPNRDQGAFKALYGLVDYCLERME